MSSFLIALSVSLITGLVLGILNKSVTAAMTPAEEGKYFLIMHKSYKFLGYGSVILGLVICVGIFFIEKTDYTAIVSIILMFLFFTIMGMLSVLYFKRHYIKFDDHSIEVKNIFNTIETYTWDVIDRGKLNKVSGAIVFKTKDGRKFNVHQHLIGINHFFDMLKLKTGIVIDLSYN